MLYCDMINSKLKKTEGNIIVDNPGTQATVDTGQRMKTNKAITQQ